MFVGAGAGGVQAYVCWRCNGATVAGPTQLTVAAATEYSWTAITVAAVTDVFEVQIACGIYDDGVAAPVEVPSTCSWTSARARLSHATFT